MLKSLLTGSWMWEPWASLPSPKLLNPGTSAYLDHWIPPLQQCDGQQYALLEDPVTGCIHDEIDDQIRGSFFVEVALDLCQTQFSSSPNARTDNY